jgi:hypothetical protein
MRVAVARADLGAYATERAVFVGDDARGIDGPDEARPSGARIELVDRAEERLTRDHVDVETDLVIVPKRVLKRRLGRVVLRHLVLHRRQTTAKLAIGRLVEFSRGHRDLLLLACPAGSSHVDLGTRGRFGLHHGARGAASRARRLPATAEKR